MSIKKNKLLIKEQYKNLTNPYMELIKNYSHHASSKEINSSKNAVLEIGCGSGIFLNRYATEDREYFGVDTRYKRVVAALDKSIDKSNIFFIREDANSLLSKVDDNKIKEVHIYFPDPWPKKKHHKNRILNSNFLTLLKAKLSTDGKLFFKTDHDEYFEWASKNIEEHFKILKYTQDLNRDGNLLYPNHIENIETEFEAMFNSKQVKINALLACSIS